jgi:hypothetical protein
VSSRALGDLHVITSRQPLYDGVRALLDLGYPEDTPVTIRHEGKGYDSFVPQKLGVVAQ